MVGEEAHRKGEDGTRRAKLWLDSTTRLRQAWTHDDAVTTSRLQFSWPHGGQSFSFDLGGTLGGEPFQHHGFMAECKKYKSALDQGEHFDKFLAQCYVVRASGATFAEHFMWITWAAFRTRTWDVLANPESIIKALLSPANRERVFGTKDEVKAREQIDVKIVENVAASIWVIVLSDKQEQLVISADHRGWLVQEQIKRGEY